MMSNKGALSLAECRLDYKVDCSLTLNNGRMKKDFVLRTSLDQLSAWKAKHAVSVSAFEGEVGNVTKDAAIIDGEVWVFGINASIANDIFSAVKIGMNHYKVKANDIIGDVYVKNLNAEHESDMGSQALINANKKLYSGVCLALIDAAKLLGVQGIINFWVVSSNINHKIPQKDLHEALTEGGANSVTTDDKNIHLIKSGGNDGRPGLKFKQNLHLATLKI